ncbi:MAG: aminotransferase class I/II-fold pyridoxal phosphate-dependent enzyme [Proteobacteria bacterium]|nr:aminotransferase class I/II-fold pyridoxal phosphate-dependent enzyme [Pseudomonadota bacterium]
MRFHEFLLEKFQSEREQQAEFNYSDSSVEPVVLGELLELAGVPAEELLQTPLHYPEVNGQRDLRCLCAGLYDGAGPDNLLVTVGASEANAIIVDTLFEPGDAVAVMEPTYLQLAGLARNRGLRVDSFYLRHNGRWSLDVESLEAAVTAQTKAIALVNPNNPTGYILGPDEGEAIIRAADRVGAWIIADEVYAGTERLTDEITPSFYGRYDRVLAVNSTSKAYGLPGLRCGWIAGPTDTITALWRRHEYATISASVLANRLATLALSSPVRAKLLARSKSLIRRGFKTLETILAEHEGVFSVIPPMGSAVAFVRYDLAVNSVQFAQGLFEQKSVLVVPGDCFGLDRHIRVASGLSPDYAKPGLQRLSDYAGQLR